MLSLGLNKSRYVLKTEYHTAVKKSCLKIVRHRKMFVVYHYVETSQATRSHVYESSRWYTSCADLLQNSKLFPDVTIIGQFSPHPLFLFICPLTFLQLTGITCVTLFKWKFLKLDEYHRTYSKCGHGCVDLEPTYIAWWEVAWCGHWKQFGGFSMN